jgi:hypothetical protein
MHVNGRMRAMDDDRPHETAAERADRNFLDLLQELRVTQTGVQIMFAFLLTMPLQSRFDDLDRWERSVFVAALLFSALATACLIAPVAVHRALFQRRKKPELVRVAARFAVAGLFFLALAVVSAVDLVLGLVLGRSWAGVAAGVLLAVIVLLWAVVPLLLRRRESVAAGGRGAGG